jgi:hypothetical protein
MIRFVCLACLSLLLFGGVMTAQPAHADKEGKLRHLVLFKYKETASEAQIQKIEAAFAALPSKINTIRDFEMGKNISEEGLDQGFTHCYLVTFDDKAGLDVYLPHPDHQAFVELLKPSLDKVFVVDFVGK